MIAFDSINFHKDDDKIILNKLDGEQETPIKEYTRDQAQQYLADTDRPDDLVAMGWKSE